MTFKVDWRMIEKYEISTNFGYAIPGDERSGITVGSGFDLGQHNKQQIDLLAISDTLKCKLKPFAQLKGIAARNALYYVPEVFDTRRPISTQIQPPVKRVVSTGVSSAYVLRAVAAGLELSEPEVTELNAAVRSAKLNRVIGKFDRDASTCAGKPFKTIPATCQTAIVSFCWQYGENIDKTNDRRGDYWKLVVRGNWTGAIELLLSEFMGPLEKSFSRRRFEEISLLMWGVGDLPYGPKLKQLIFQAGERSRIA